MITYKLCDFASRRKYAFLYNNNNMTSKYQTKTVNYVLYCNVYNNIHILSWNKGDMF